MTTKRLTITAEPVTAAEIKTLMPLDGTDQDSRIAILIPALRQRAEQITGRALATGNFSLTLDSFPAGAIMLHSGPVTEIVSVAYTDTAGVAQTLTGYQLDTTSLPARILPAVDTVWPDTQDIANAVTITYTAGAATAPAEVKAWIAVYVRAEIDGCTVPGYMDGLLDSLKVY